MNVFLPGILFALLMVFQSCEQIIEEIVPDTVESVDLDRYLGRWYEISSIRQFFSVNCYCTTADYSVNDKGNVRVVNNCKLRNVNGNNSRIEGEARVVDKNTNSKLEVGFFQGFPYSPYWIVDLADDYSWAVVSDPLKSTLWILSRTPIMDDVLYNNIIDDLRQRKFPVGKLKRTVQACF